MPPVQGVEHTRSPQCTDRSYALFLQKDVERLEEIWYNEDKARENGTLRKEDETIDWADVVVAREHAKDITSTKGL